MAGAAEGGQQADTMDGLMDAMAKICVSQENGNGPAPSSAPPPGSAPAPTSSSHAAAAAGADAPEAEDDDDEEMTPAKEAFVLQAAERMFSRSDPLSGPAHIRAACAVSCARWFLEHGGKQFEAARRSVPDPEELKDAFQQIAAECPRPGAASFEYGKLIVARSLQRAAAHGELPGSWGIQSAYLPMEQQSAAAASGDMQGACQQTAQAGAALAGGVRGPCTPFYTETAVARGVFPLPHVRLLGFRFLSQP